MHYRILNTIGERYTDSAKEVLSRCGEVDYHTPTQEKLAEEISHYDMVLVGLGLIFNEAVLKWATQLKVIATATTGLDHIDIEYAKERGIRIVSLRGETEFLNSITGTAELAGGLMLALLRHIPASFDSVKNYEWDRERFRGRTLQGKTLGIVGIGRLGTWMARYGKAFGMDVIFFDPHVTQSSVAGCRKVKFEELLNQSDVVSIHIHLTPETENLFTIDVFKKMKPVAYIINTSRGAIVNESDLLKALQENVIAGYGADVLTGELHFSDSFSDHPLVEYAKKNTNVLIVPHIGGMTYESREATDVFIAKKLEATIQEL